MTSSPSGTCSTGPATALPFRAFFPYAAGSSGRDAVATLLKQTNPYDLRKKALSGYSGGIRLPRVAGVDHHFVRVQSNSGVPRGHDTVAPPCRSRNLTSTPS